MDTHKKQQKSIGALLRWLALSLLFAGTHVLAQTGGTVTYVYTDPQGTPLAEADASGNITATFEYTPYGTYTPQGTSTPGPAPQGPGYTGHVNDPETNLVYMQARYYDPVSGRFLSQDPIGIGVAEIYSFNRYAYADNNPGTYIDVDGLATTTAPVIVTATVYDDLALQGLRGLLMTAGTVGVGVSLYLVDSNSFHDKFLPNTQTCYGSRDCQGHTKLYNDSDEAPVPGAKPGRETKGRTKQWEKEGGYPDADRDFKDKNPENVKDIPGGGKVGALPDGRTIIIRPTSTDGRPTLEIQDGKNRIKIRYGS